MMKPDFIVIGAQKSASTFLQVNLQAHPDIFLPEGETPYFENPDYDETPESDFEKIFLDRSETIKGIKRPNYIGKPEVPGRIIADLPDAKIIAVLRDPIARAISAYFHQIKYGTLPAVEIEVGMRQILDGDLDYLSSYPRGSEVLEFGLYYKYLSLYRHYFENGNILILFHEDIIANAENELRKAFDFLGADNDFLSPSINKKPQKVTYSIPRLAFLARRNRYLHHYNTDYTRLTRRKLSGHEFLYVAAITAVDRFVLSRILTSEKPMLSDALHSRLAEYYKADIQALSEALGRDLSHWGKS